MAIDIQGLNEFKKDTSKIGKYWEEIKNSYNSFNNLCHIHDKIADNIEKLRLEEEAKKKLTEILTNLDEKRKKQIPELNPNNSSYINKWLEKLATT